jgi:predicted RNase H-like HicB family nuclease
MSELMKHLVIIEETIADYSAFSPDLPGCVATGSSKEEVEKNMKDAVAFHLEGMDQEGLEVPKPHSFSTYLEVSA